MDGNVKALIAAPEKPLTEKDAAGASGINVCDVKTALAFPITFVFCYMLFYSINDLNAHQRFGSSVLTCVFCCLGCMLMILTPERLFFLVSRFALGASAVGYLGYLLIPGEFPKTALLALGMCGSGALTIYTAYLFTRLDNNQRLLGLVLLGAIPVIPGLKSLQIPVLWLDLIYITILAGMIVCVFPLRPPQAKEHAAQRAQPGQEANYWLLVYVLCFFTLSILVNEHLSAIGALMKSEYILAGAAAVILFLAIQVVFKRGVWHMWNTALLLTMFGVAFLWIPGGSFESIGRFLLNLMMPLFFILYFYMVTGVMQRNGTFGFFKTYLAACTGGLGAVGFLAWLVIRLLPGYTLVILTIWTGVVSVILLLLTPMLSQKLFTQRWVDGLNKPGAEANHLVERRAQRATPEKEAQHADFTRRLETLTPTEREVFRHMCAGKSNSEIAAQMYISVSTLKKHNTHIFAKLNVTCRGDIYRAIGASGSDQHNKVC